MLDGISKATEYAYSCLPTQSKTIQCAKTVLLSTIALEALSNISGASAGPVTYAACLAGCAFAAPPAIPFCLAACSVSLGPWCP